MFRRYSIDNRRRDINRSPHIGNRGSVLVIVALLLMVCFVLSSVPLVTSATTTQERLDQEKAEREQAQRELEETAQEKDDLEETQQEYEVKLGELNDQLTEVSNNLTDLEQAIVEKKTEISTTEQALAEAIRIRDEQYEAMKLRIKFMYEKRDFVLLESLLAAADFSDFLNRNEYYEQLAEYDEKKLIEFKQIEADVTATRDRLIAEKEELDGLAAEVRAEQDRYTGLVNGTLATISGYDDQISQAEQEMIAHEQEIKERDANIKVLKEQLAEEQRLSELAAQMTWRSLSEVSFAEGDRKLLANLIYCEAGNQPYTGQVAVGAVVMNRVLSPVFPNTIIEVIYQNKQFSPVASQRLALALTEDRATAACYRAADEAMAGASPVGNFLFFRTPIPELEGKGIAIGGHIFY
ncbi:MAG: cell wall hydrolase [Lachnospiraceae bacterium]|jgi:spore germination cell wall hydrolase CwlJ-like protein|nr:cell wall hydrolase [Lachnospiraceae bacterium]